MARALVAAPRVLLLDDVTSAVDAANEATLVDAVRALGRDRIVIVAGHRAALLDVATRTLTLTGAHPAQAPADQEALCRPT